MLEIALQKELRDDLSIQYEDGAVLCILCHTFSRQRIPRLQLATLGNSARGSKILQVGLQKATLKIRLDI